MTSVRSLTVLSLLLLVAAGAAEAGVAKQCRKRCKPDIAECVRLTGQPKRLCKRSILRVCKDMGLDSCGGGSPGGGGGPTTTTTTLPAAPGRVDIEIQDVDRDTTTDPGVYSFLVLIRSDADSVPLALDPSLFFVIDQSLTRHASSPATADPDDCSAGLILAPGAQVVCTVRVVLPLAVGAEPEIGGERFARLQLEGGGYIDANDFQLSDGGLAIIM